MIQSASGVSSGAFLTAEAVSQHLGGGNATTVQQASFERALAKALSRIPTDSLDRILANSLFVLSNRRMVHRLSPSPFRGRNYLMLGLDFLEQSGDEQAAAILPLAAHCLLRFQHNPGAYRTAVEYQPRPDQELQLEVPAITPEVGEMVRSWRDAWKVASEGVTK